MLGLSNGVAIALACSLEWGDIPWKIKCDGIHSFTSPLFFFCPHGVISRLGAGTVRRKTWGMEGGYPVVSRQRRGEEIVSRV